MSSYPSAREQYAKWGVDTEAALNALASTARLALMEDARSLPWGAVWEEYCRRNDKPADGQWLPAVREYETRVLAKR